MSDKVSFNQVQQYAQLNNLDFKTAASKLGLSASQTNELSQLGGDPGVPVDDFSPSVMAAPATETSSDDGWLDTLLKGAKKYGKKAINVVKEYAVPALVTTAGGAVGFFIGGPGGAVAGAGLGLTLVSTTSCSPMEPELYELPDDKEKKDPVINVKVNLNTNVIIKAGMSVEDFKTALKDIFNQFGFEKIADIAAALEQLGLDISEIASLLADLKTQQQENHEEIKQAHAIIIAMMEKLVAEMKDNGEKLDKIITELKSNNVKLDDIIAVLLKQNYTLDAILEELKNQGVKLDEQSDLLGKIDEKLDNLDANGKDALKQILIAINTNSEVAKGTQEFVKELLDKIGFIGKDTNAILEVVAKIAAKEPCETKDYQDMLQKILDAINKNGNVLGNINTKLEFAAVALEGLKAQIEGLKEQLKGDSNAILNKLQEILDRIPETCNCEDVDLTLVIEKLNEIIVKMQTQDNGNHEGILGDLDSLDSLL